MLAILGLGVAFIVMASIFVPGNIIADPDEPPPPGLSGTPAPGGAFESTDAHEGLQSLGVLEHKSYLVAIYATDIGPRYTVYDRATGEELGTLLREHQVEYLFPDLPIRSLEFGKSTEIMMHTSTMHSIPD